MNCLGTLVVLLVVTFSSVARSLPTPWDDTSKETSTDSVKPLADSNTRPTVCPESSSILEPLKSVLPSPPIANTSSQPSDPSSETDNPSSSTPAPSSSLLNSFSTSSDFLPEFTTSCETPPTLDQIRSNNNNTNTSDKLARSIETPVFYTNPLPSLTTDQLSDLGRMLQDYNQNAESAISFRQPIHTPLPDSTSLASLRQLPASITSPSKYTTLDAKSSPISHSAPSPIPSSSPFPGSTLMHIEPLKLSPRNNQELLKLLSDFSTTSLQETFQEPYPTPTLPSSSTSLSEMSQILSPSPSTPPTTVLQPSPTPSNSSDSPLNVFASTPPTINQSDSNFSYSASSFNSNPLPTATHQSLTTKSNGLNPELIKYLNTLSSNRPS